MEALGSLVPCRQVGITSRILGWWRRVDGPVLGCWCEPTVASPTVAANPSSSTHLVGPRLVDFWPFYCSLRLERIRSFVWRAVLLQQRRLSIHRVRVLLAGIGMPSAGTASRLNNLIPLQIFSRGDSPFYFQRMSLFFLINQLRLFFVTIELALLFPFLFHFHFCLLFLVFKTRLGF